MSCSQPANLLRPERSPMLNLTNDLMLLTKRPAFQAHRDDAEDSRSERLIAVATNKLAPDDLAELVKVATDHGDLKVARAVEAILRGRGGDFGKPIPNFMAFQDTLEQFLRQDLLDGWIYVRHSDGRLYPELVLSVEVSESSSYRKKEEPKVVLHTKAYGLGGEYKEELGLQNLAHHFSPGEVTKRRVADALAEFGIFKETESLKRDYLKDLKRYQAEIAPQFSEQFRVNGGVYRFETDHYQRRSEEQHNRRVVHDIETAKLLPLSKQIETNFACDDADGVGPIPEHPLVRVFDLKNHEFFWVHSECMTPYEYNTALRDKLILPESHRDLLDVLTSDLGAFVEDIVEGKSAGNVILCKGVPGVGKTLTAEVYAELIKRPLYAIRSGSLGTTADAIDKNLQEIFQLAKRWRCVLLLDEADVFVTQRGTNIEQNAIVAEFLRALEYFDGLLFMTTNRPGDIDDAIEARCAAIIHYEVPGPTDAEKIWLVMAKQQDTTLSAELISQLLATFPGIAPRGIKMLLRLTLRVAHSAGDLPTIDTFRRAAMFRAVTMASNI